MKKSAARSFVLIFSLILFFSAPAAQSQDRQLPGVTLQNTELRTLKSRFVDQEYKLQIFLPPGYADASKSFPVLYLLDGDKSFGMARDIVDWLIFRREIPQIIIVGIAYDEGSKVWWDKRSRDYTPWKDRAKIWGEWPLAGGADNFRKFMQEELVPFIDSNYRTVKNDRAIAGLSLGGLFAAYVLFTEPSLFQRYILSGAGLIWDDSHLFKIEEEYSSKNKSLPVCVYTAVGELDDKKIIKPWMDFTAILEKRQYEGLKLSAETIKGETHISAWPPSLTRGLKSVFAKTNQIDVAADRTAVKKADAEWLQAVNKKDIKLVLSFYLDDATWLLRGVPAQTGKDSIRQTWMRWFNTPGATIRWEPMKVEVSISSDLGYSVGSFETKQLDKEGKITIQRGGYVAVWKKAPDGNWKIAIDISN